MIKKLFKFIFKLILFVIILVAIVVGVSIYMISDKTDNAPINSYDTTQTVETVLAQQLNSGLNDMPESYNLDIVFDEDSLNQILFAVVRKSLNPDFDPKSDDKAKTYAYCFELPKDLPVVGGWAMGAKNVYGEVEGEEVTINVTADVANFIKTRIYFTFKVETTENDYVLTITKIKFGKINLAGSLVKTALKSFDVDSMVNNAIGNTKLPFVFNSADFTLTCTKEDFSDAIKGLLKTDESDNEMTATFLNLFLDPKNDMIKFGMFTKGFGIEINLKSLEVEASKTVLNPSIQAEFDQEQMMSGKAQALVINSLSNPSGDKYLTFTELDFSQLIYNQMDQYKDFKIQQELLAGVNFNFSVDGITFDIDDTGSNLAIEIILNINGLKTLAVLNGKIVQVSDEEVKITLSDKINLGKSLEIDSKFMTDMLKNSFSDDSIMKFDSATNSFVFTTAVFNSFLGEAMGSSSTPMEVSKLQFDKDCLKIFVQYTDTTLLDKMNTVTTLINDALKDGITLDSSKFSADDQETMAAVQQELGDISEKLSSGTLSAEDTDSLLEQVNSMSAEGQAAFYEQITDTVGATDPTALEELYNSMFK